MWWFCHVAQRKGPITTSVAQRKGPITPITASFFQTVMLPWLVEVEQHANAVALRPGALDALPVEGAGAADRSPLYVE